MQLALKYHKCFKILFRKCGGTRQLGRLKRTWEYNIKIVFEEVLY